LDVLGVLKLPVTVANASLSWREKAPPANAVIARPGTHQDKLNAHAPD